MIPMRRLVLLTLVLLAGCGGATLEPLADVRPVVATAFQKGQMRGTMKTATTKNQISSGNPSFQ